jgi:ubiquinone/menaquinone biosynthesis C-methylase UbiE
MNIKLKKKKYWNKFYSKKKAPLKSSSFAVFCLKFIKNKSNTIIDIGCGNGRDTVFFLKRGYECYGIDQSKSIISKNKKLYPKFKKYFLCKDLSKINFNKVTNKSFSVYSRFSLHAINNAEEKAFLNNLIKSNNLKFLMIETRTIYDDLFGKGTKISKNEYLTDHYRRFIDPNKIKGKLKKKFRLIYSFLGKNVAKFKKENPKVLRIILTNER